MIPAPFLFQPALHYFPMEITRRIFAFSLLIAPFIFSVAGGSADKPAANRKYLVFVGTYTTKTESKGIYAYEFDADAEGRRGGDAGPVVGGGAPRRKIFVCRERSRQGEHRERFRGRCEEREAYA